MTWQEELNKKRVADGWYGCIAPDGWQKIVLETDEMLAHIDPDYQFQQIKEKYGTLRYYFSSKHAFDSVEGKIMNAITRSAEMKSSGTCEICGKWGELDDSQYYIRTLCEDHRTDNDENS